MDRPRPENEPGVIQISTEDVELPPTDPAPQPNSPGPPAHDDQPAPESAAPVKPRRQLEPGVGLEGEFIVWEGRYSYKNFLGRLILRVVASIAWLALAYWAWERTTETVYSLEIFTTIVGFLVLFFWLQLLWKVVQARLSHFYRLTNKRLFVWSGIFQRRNDQLELVKVNDVYTSYPSLPTRLLNVGTVVIESREERFPMVYLTGVDKPDRVMDTIWRTSHDERDGHTIRVDQV